MGSTENMWQVFLLMMLFRGSLWAVLDQRLYLPIDFGSVSPVPRIPNKCERASILCNKERVIVFTKCKYQNSLQRKRMLKCVYVNLYNGDAFI